MGIAEGVGYTYILSSYCWGKTLKHLGSFKVFFFLSKYCLTVNTIVSNFKILRQVPYFLLKMNPFSKLGLPAYCFFLCIQDICLQKVFFAASHADLRQETQLSKQEQILSFFSFVFSSYIPYGKIM